MSDNIENICPQCGLPNQRASSLEKENYQLAFELKECEEQLQKLKEVLEDAQTGLKWYQEEHPEDASPVDDELHEKIDELLNQTNLRAKL